jgi:preprotein translocase subunit SecG
MSGVSGLFFDTGFAGFAVLTGFFALAFVFIFLFLFLLGSHRTDSKKFRPVRGSDKR